MAASLAFLPIVAIAAPTAEQLARLPPPAGHSVDFAREIRPLLDRACLECHGPKKQKGGFRLDVRIDALAGGENFRPAIVPGDSAASPLIHAVAALDEDFVMPEKGDPLTPGEIGLLRAWIDQGAVWPEDGLASTRNQLPWSFAPLTRPPVPSAAATASITSPVDAFLAAALGARNLTFSPAADRRTLARRLHLVLLGLPPAPEDVAAFERDPDPLAFEKRVDRLLASPQFGERFAQPWLDAVRFAETNGSESNLYRRNAWPYRDYVIRAFNADLPLDQFIQEQIAGDALGADEATTFLVNGVFVTPDTVGKEEQAMKQARADQLEETIQSVSSAVLGVTLGCARCHNHKFDPIPQQDYYALAAVFQGLQYGTRPWLTHPDAAARARRATALEVEISATRDELHRVTPSWTEQWPAHFQTHFVPTPTRVVRVIFPAGASGSIDELEIYGPDSGNENLALATRGATARSSKVTEDEIRPAMHLIDGVKNRFRNWNFGGTGGKSESSWCEIELPSEALVGHIAISTDRDTLENTDYITDRSPVGPARYRVALRHADGTWHEVAAVDLGKVDNPRAKLRQAAAARLTGKSDPADPPVEPAAAAPALPPEVREPLARVERLAREYSAQLPPPLFAGFFLPPPPAFLLGRGDPMNPRDEVMPNALSALGAHLGLTSQSSDLERRLAFARWLTDPRQNPLTPRVLANRLWLQVFGRGIVDTPGDFGHAGSPPSHPALLDWLARELVDQGWSAKKLVRLLVTSTAFRQSAAPNPAAARIDAEARLLWRFPPRRAEAEVLRDGTLAVAGTLDRTMGGPGFRIHGDKRRYESWQVVDNHGPTTWRRLIYQERMRGIDDQMFTAFDRPECGQVTPKRIRSTTPLQALNLFNGPFILGQAEQFAGRVAREAGDDPTAQIARAFALAFARAPSAQESADSRALVRLDGLPSLCRALLNANEFAFIE